MGFRSEPQSKTEKRKDIMQEVSPEDLLKFGLIPEFIGRLPVITALNELDEETLIQILTGPKNAVMKQYARLLEKDGVELEVEDGALVEIAQEALKRKTGARALRAIIEQIMLEVMYEVPSQTDVKKVILRDGVLAEKRPPLMLTAEQIKTAS